MIPIGRMGVPEEIASIVQMLVQNEYMTNKVTAYNPVVDISKSVCRSSLQMVA